MSFLLAADCLAVLRGNGCFFHVLGDNVSSLVSLGQLRIVEGILHGFIGHCDTAMLVSKIDKHMAHGIAIQVFAFNHVLDNAG